MSLSTSLTEGMVFNRFEITELEPERLRGRVYGDKIDPAHHSIKLGVKAATYHTLAISKDNGYRLRVLFDI